MQKQWPQFEHSLFPQVHCVSVNQDLQKDLARRINIINGKSINSIYTAPAAKEERHMISLIQSISAQDVQS